jgi:hypothetical protein
MTAPDNSNDALEITHAQLVEFEKQVGVVNSVTSDPLWEFIEPKIKMTDSCWIWRGPTRKKKGRVHERYGYVNLPSGGTRAAHNLIYEMWTGHPLKGKQVKRICDTSLCVLPQHQMAAPHSFWHYVNRTTGDECWLWTGVHDADCYGQCKWYGETAQAHRASWVYAYQPTELLEAESENNKAKLDKLVRLPEDVIIRHVPVVCESRTCVRPTHLLKGNRRDNEQDKLVSSAWEKQQECDARDGGRKVLPDREGFIARVNAYMKRGDHAGLCGAVAEVWPVLADSLQKRADPAMTRIIVDHLSARLPVHEPGKPHA